MGERDKKNGETNNKKPCFKSRVQKDRTVQFSGFGFLWFNSLWILAAVGFCVL
jgi:hypothetical protein